REAHPGFSIRSEMETNQDRIGFAARLILDNIGIQTTLNEPTYLDQMLEKFGLTFPTTSVFSSFARESFSDLELKENPDVALLTWMEREEVLFRTFETHLLNERLQQTALAPEPIMRRAMSFLQRRRSRAGAAFENHLEEIFRQNDICYTRGGYTEGRQKPDFLFPSIQHYHDPNFPEICLTMLAAKTTCKDRWRQILPEAARIPEKHLATLEPSISEKQTEEMAEMGVRLVLPLELHATYLPSQQKQLLNVTDFIALAKQRQAAGRSASPRETITRWRG
ncbi:MAG: type II restriction endonuclease, partial [Chthoniobacterales bacterium]